VGSPKRELVRALEKVYTRAVMNNDFPKLNLQSFSLGYEDFFSTVKSILNESDNNGSLIYLIPNDIDAQYRYSEHKRNHQPRYAFLLDKFLKLENNDLFLSFFNEVINSKFEAPEPSSDIWKNCPGLRTSMFKLSDLIDNINNSAVFTLEFYFDKKSKQIKRKLDPVTIETINLNAENITTGNDIRYQECVEEFLSFKRDFSENNNLFYNNSLDKLKRVVENTLKNEYVRDGGLYPKISDRKQISNILFDKENTDFENRIKYIVENIHHEKSGQPKKFSEKEYTYLWLELNQILYLLNRYKK
jgi:hypothetical protein